MTIYLSKLCFLSALVLFFGIRSINAFDEQTDESYKLMHDCYRELETQYGDDFAQVDVRACFEEKKSKQLRGLDSNKIPCSDAHCLYKLSLTGKRKVSSSQFAGITTHEYEYTYEGGGYKFVYNDPGKELSPGGECDSFYIFQLLYNNQGEESIVGNVGGNGTPNYYHCKGNLLGAELIPVDYPNYWVLKLPNGRMR